MKTLSIIALFASQVVFAATGKQPLSWENFVEACKNPAAFANQVPQDSFRKIKVTCAKNESKWVPLTTKGVSVFGDTTVTPVIDSDKYSVVGLVGKDNTQANSTEYYCPKLQKQTHYVETPAEVTCAQIKDPAFSLYDFCDKVATETLATVEFKPTEEYTSPCDSVVPQTTTTQQKPRTGGSSDRNW